MPKLDRLARSVPDARHIGDSLVARGIKLSLGGTLYDPTDPLGKMFFNILATFAEFEVDLLRLRTREGMAVARAKGKCSSGNASNCVHSGMRSAISTDAAAGPGTGSRRAAGPRPDAAGQGAIRGTFCR